MAVITNHAKRRMSDRADIGSKKSAEKNASRAFRDGIRHNEASGKLRRWMDGRFLKYRNITDMRISQQSVRLGS